jgi:hypothetical protein
LGTNLGAQLDLSFPLSVQSAVIQKVIDQSEHHKAKLCTNFLKNKGKLRNFIALDNPERVKIV